MTLIGVVTGMDSHHFATRLLTNGLIDTFFFFAMGLGALFFLALAYATETGWYASVKRIIEAVAGYLPYGMGLMGLVLLIITLMDGAHVYQWMDPEVVAHDEIITDDPNEDIAADRLKNAAATKKLAIFDAFEILNRIEQERAKLNGEDESETSKGKDTGFQSFAERRSRKS